MNINNTFLPLFVTEQGPISSKGMALGLNGDTPVFLNPAIMFLGVIDAFQVGTKTSQKLTLLSGRPLLYFLSWDSQLILKAPKGAEYRGGRRCEVWGDCQYLYIIRSH